MSRAWGRGTFKPRKLSLSTAPDRDWYTPAELKQFNMSELKKEYTALRDITQKRIKRMNEKFPDYKETAYYPQGGFPKISQLQKESKSEKELERKLRQALSDVSRFVNTPSTTVSGQEEINDRRYAKLLEYGLLNGDETEAERRGIMKFVHWVAETQKMDILYRAKFQERIQSQRFKTAISKTYGIESKDYGRQNYARWYREITGESARRDTRPKKADRTKKEDRRKSSGDSSSFGF